jgi:hypothetical protein
MRSSALSSRLMIGAAVIAMALAAAGCGHKLVASNGAQTVKVYPDEDTYHKVESMKTKGGPVGMLGGLGENLLAKDVAANTKVRIVSSDANGSQIEVLDGPDKGLKGFVAKANVD